MGFTLLSRLRGWLDAQLRGDEVTTTYWRRNWLRSTRLIVLVARRFRSDLCLERAASLAFSSVIAVIPATLIFLFSVQMLGSYENPEEILQPAIEFVTRYVTDDQKKEVVDSALKSLVKELDAQSRLQDLMVRSKDSAGWVTGVGILVLLLSALTLFRSAERAFTGIWRVANRRGLFEKLATFWLLLTAAPAILSVSIYVKRNLVSSMTSETGWGTPPRVGLDPWTLPVVDQLLRVCVALRLSYPTRVVQLSAAAGGALVSAIGWQLGTEAFELYVESTLLSGLLGVLGVIPFFLLWVYFSWTIVLVGAETSYCLQHYRTLVAETWGRRQERTVARPTLALLVLEQVYRHFRGEGSPPTADSLARRLGVEIGEIEEVVSVLTRAEMLVPKDHSWLPGSSAEQLQLAAVVELFPTRAGFRLPSALDSLDSPLARLLREVDAGIYQHFQGSTFATVIEQEPPSATY